MSPTSAAQANASRVPHSHLLELLTRTGFIGYGVVHLLFAGLAAQIAFGTSSDDGDQSGAMRALAAQPLGRFLVVTIGIGLLAMATWQALEAAFGHREDRGGERAAERVFSAARALVYLYFAWTAYKVFSNANSDSADRQQALTEKLMSAPGGRWLVGLVGLVLAGVGIGMIGYGVIRRFEKHLRMGRMSPGTRLLARRLGVAGYAAKGVAYAIAGLLVVVAAVRFDPDRARGLDAALHALREQSYGTLLLAIVALGIAAFAAFCLVQAKYRKV